MERTSKAPNGDRVVDSSATDSPPTRPIQSLCVSRPSRFPVSASNARISTRVEGEKSRLPAWAFDLEQLPELRTKTPWLVGIRADG